MPSTKRDWNRSIAEETLRELEGDSLVRIAHDATITYLPGKLEDLPLDKPASSSAGLFPEVIILPKTTVIAACLELSTKVDDLCALNFASAKNPGGGFLRGANAQEESICRVSGLYLCLEASPMYDLNRRDNNRTLYAHSGIYSPRVPITKNDSGVPQDDPVCVSFVSVPAVNRKVAMQKKVPTGVIDKTMYDRMDYCLRLMARHKHRNIILGSYGCGVFGNDLQTVLRGFKKLLRTKYSSHFDQVYFPCICDASAETTRSIFR